MTSFPSLPRLSLSLRRQVALVVAVLSFLPNSVMLVILLLPLYRQGVDLSGTYLPVSLWLGLVAFISAAIGYTLSSYLFLPLTNLTEQIETMQRRAERFGQARLEVAERGPCEIEALAIAFNRLLRQLGNEQERRNAFLATLMHDLKTPLVASTHLLKVIRDLDSLPREERVNLVAQILREQENLIELVQKMVEAHRFEREGVLLRRQPHELEPIVRTVAERVTPLAAERGLTLSVRGRARAVVDARELERALYNLVSNAVRYARSEIGLEVFPGVIRVSDDGPGLPAPLETLAQPFNSQPVTIAGQTYTAGTGGLGLFIARHIIEAHGGRLTVERTGATGTVLLVYLGQT